MADHKTWLDVLAVIGPTIVPSVAAVLIAICVTARLERQKQYMELYKSLYTERLSTAKRLQEMFAEVYTMLWDLTNVMGEQQSASVREELYAKMRSLVTFLNATEWLFTKSVAECSRAFITAAGDGLHSIRDPIKPPAFTEIEARMDGITHAVTQMMKNEYLDPMVEKPRSLIDRFLMHFRRRNSE